MSEMNSKDYWDGRFKDDWEENHGRRQSRFFSGIALRAFPEWLKMEMNAGAEVLDWGCALGDGTEYLAQALPGAQISGCDFSNEAIDQALLTYPTIKFFSADFVQGEMDVANWDFIFSSNTLEHFHEPWRIVDELARRTRRGLVFLLPYKEVNRIAEHHYTFLASNIPLSHGEFRLCYSAVIDAANLPETEWAGTQVFLIFLRNHDPLIRRLMLDDVKLDSNEAVQMREEPSVLGDLRARIDNLGVDGLVAQTRLNEALIHIAELEGRVTLEQRNAMTRIEERDNLLIENASLCEALASANGEKDQLRADNALLQAEILSLRAQATQVQDEFETVRMRLSDAETLLSETRRRVEYFEHIAKKKEYAQTANSEDQLMNEHRESPPVLKDEDELVAIAKKLSDVADSLLVRLAKTESDLDSVLASRSWRLTAPMRRFVAGMRGTDQGMVNALTNTPLLVQRLGELNARLTDVIRKNHWKTERERRGRRIFIFTGVPYDDIGGGQRAAQFARVLLGRGEVVTYVYAYPKWENGGPAESRLSVPGLTHLYVNSTGAEEVKADIQRGDVAIFELPHKAFLPYLENCIRVGARTVFELIDAWNSSLGGDWFSEDVMQQYIDRSDVVVGTAKVLEQSLVSRGRGDAMYLPNAANEAIFDGYRQYPRPSEYSDGHRALLYFGSLYGEWFDWDSVNAAARRSPDTRFYLIGDIPNSINVEDNVVFLGPRLIDELPKYLQHCHAAILPFKPGHISDAVSPIKIFEYLAMGANVVANDLPEIREYPNVWIAKNSEHFADLCGEELRAQEAEVVDRFVMENCWSARLDRIIPPLQFGRVVSVIVLMHNNAKIIRRCLDSLKMHGAEYIREIIVVDNCSSDGGDELVEAEYPEVKLIRNKRNGCSSGRNLGVASATGDYLAFFDSDQWITGRGAFEEALFLLRSNSRLGAIGWAAGWFSANNESFGGPIVDYLPARGTNVAEYREKGYRTDIGYLGSGGLFLRREVFHQVGGFDEFYDPTCFEDTDFTVAIKAAGYSIGYRDLQGVRHQAHQTTGASGQSDAYKAIFARNSGYFGKKWSARSDLLVDAPL